MTFSDDVLELTERVHDYREQVADLTERLEAAEIDARESKRLYRHTYMLYSALLDRTIEDLNRVEEKAS